MYIILDVSLLFGQSRTEFPTIRFDADARITQDARSSSVLDARTFAYTALVASGTQDENINAYLERLDSLYQNCDKKIAASTSHEDKIEATLHFLYDEVIATYSENQTRLDIALSEGSYNCVSSAILFMYMMKREGVAVSAVETPAHAFCTVQIDGKQITVETTNPWGVNPGVKKQVANDTLRGKKYVTVPATKYANSHAVDDRRIIALVYMNRIVLLQKKNNQEATVGLACDALILQNNSQIASDLVHQCIYNVCANYTRSKRNEDCLLLIKKARTLFGDSSSFKQCVSAALNNLCNDCVTQRKYDECIAVIKSNKDMVDQAEYDSLYETALTNKLTDVVNTKSFDEALGEIHAQKSVLNNNNYLKLVEYAYSAGSSALEKNGDWLGAASLCEQGLQEIPGKSTLSRIRATDRNNYALTVHNKAAALYNAGDIDGARKIIEDGLKIVDESTVLKNDLKRLCP